MPRSSSQAGLDARALSYALAIVRRRRDAVASIELLPHQAWPAGDWNRWVIQGGRGSGKTFPGAYWGLDHMRQLGRDAWLGILAPTIGDARDVCIEGPSGLYTLFRDEFTSYNRSGLTLRHRSGGRIWAHGAEEPERLRGPACSMLWIDEAGVISQKHPASIDNALPGLRLGSDPRAILTTTPRPTPWLRKILKDPGTVVTRGRTRDNPHLAQKAVDDLEKQYGGTRLGRQELDGELLEDIEGAWWKQTQIDEDRRALREVPQLVRVVVAIDPPGSHKRNPAEAEAEDRAECGLAVAGLGIDGHRYLFASEGMRVLPPAWARRSIALYHEWRADTIIGEANYGGDMVESTIRAQWASAPFKMVWASRGKVLRAEPVAMLWEQRKVHHVGVFPELEDQMCQFGYDVQPKLKDRFDAMVWAMTALDGGKPQTSQLHRVPWA